MYDLIILMIESSSIIITFASSHMSRSESTEFAPTTDDVTEAQQKQNIEEGEREFIFHMNLRHSRIWREEKEKFLVSPTSYFPLSHTVSQCHRQCNSRMWTKRENEKSHSKYLTIYSCVRFTC